MNILHLNRRQGRSGSMQQLNGMRRIFFLTGLLVAGLCTSVRAYDCGARGNDPALGIVVLNCEDPSDPAVVASPSPLKIMTKDGVRGLHLVSVIDPSATNFRVRYRDSVQGKDVTKAIGNNSNSAYTPCEWLQMFGHSPDPAYSSQQGDPISLPSDIDCSDTNPANQGKFTCANAATSPGSLWKCGYTARFPNGFDMIQGPHHTASGDFNDDPSGNPDPTLVENTLSLTNLGPNGFSPIGTKDAPFKRIFKGNGHVIKGLFINRPNSERVGLFGAAADTSIQNVNLFVASVTGKNYVGALVGYMTGMSISQTYITADIAVVGSPQYGGGNDVGGMVGYASASILDNISFMGKVKGGNNVGAFVGYLHNSKMIDAHVPGISVDGTDSIGGLVGLSDPSSLNNVSFIGVVGGRNYVGGLVGYSISTTISKSYHQCEVSGTEMVGGLVGRNEAGSDISECYSMGIVKGTKDVGGLVGNNSASAISDTYSTGNVTGATHGGGLVGTAQSGSISRSYASGNVSGSEAGGLVGILAAGVPVVDSFSTGTLTSKPAPNGGFLGQIGNIGDISNGAWVTTAADNAIGVPLRKRLATPAPVRGKDYVSTEALLIKVPFSSPAWQTPSGSYPTLSNVEGSQDRGNVCGPDANCCQKLSAGCPESTIQKCTCITREDGTCYNDCPGCPNDWECVQNVDGSARLDTLWPKPPATEDTTDCCPPKGSSAPPGDTHKTCDAPDPLGGTTQVMFPIQSACNGGGMGAIWCPCCPTAQWCPPPPPPLVPTGFTINNNPTYVGTRCCPKGTRCNNGNCEAVLAICNDYKTEGNEECDNPSTVNDDCTNAKKYSANWQCDGTCHCYDSNNSFPGNYTDPGNYTYSGNGTDTGNWTYPGNATDPGNYSGNGFSTNNGW